MANEISKASGSLPEWGKIIFRILRKLWVPILCLLALYAGLVIGYTYLGGMSSSEILQWNTWRHMFDLVFAES